MLNNIVTVVQHDCVVVDNLLCNRGDMYKLEIFRRRLDTRKFFSIFRRVVFKWNKLGANLFGAKNFNLFLIFFKLQTLLLGFHYCTHTHVRVRMSTHTYKHTRTRAHARAHTHAHTHKHTHIFSTCLRLQANLSGKRCYMPIIYESRS